MKLCYKKNNEIIEIPVESEIIYLLSEEEKGTDFLINTKKEYIVTINENKENSIQSVVSDMISTIDLAFNTKKERVSAIDEKQKNTLNEQNFDIKKAQ